MSSGDGGTAIPAILTVRSAVRKRLSAQIVTSPAKFRKQISDVGQALQQEQQELRHTEKKHRELTAWMTTIEDAQLEVAGALEAAAEVKAEVDRHKLCSSELKQHHMQLASNKENIQGIAQALANISRQVSRGEEKLNYLRKQMLIRSEDGQASVDDMQRQVSDFSPPMFSLVRL